MATQLGRASRRNAKIVFRTFATGRNNSHHALLEDKAALVGRLMAAKDASGKTFDEIAKGMGVTNAYAAQLFLNQAQLKTASVPRLAELIPALDASDLQLMTRCPLRTSNPAMKQEPLIYRLEEAISLYGEGLKCIINEKFGDGIMSAIDFYCTVEKTKGAAGEDRVVIKFDGKFLPHIEQKVDKK